MSEKKGNLEILAEYTRRMLHGDVQAVYDIWAPDFVTHVAPRVSPEAVGMDQRPGEVMFWEESAKAFPDRRFVVHKLWEVDGGDTVICHYSMLGTHSGGGFFGTPPSGKQVEINGTAILRFENGKIVEHWGGPHCMHGIGLLNVAEPFRSQTRSLPWSTLPPGCASPQRAKHMDRTMRSVERNDSGSDSGHCTEPEIKEPVLECLPDGRLNPAAVGWSRQPLHHCNLRGHWPRKKLWDYWCVTTDDHLFSITYANLDYLGLAVASFLDFTSETALARTVMLPLGVGFAHPETVGGGDIFFERRGLRLAIREETEGTRLQASYRSGGTAVEADLLVERPAGHQTMNVVIPWSETRFQFTSKQTCRPARGTVKLGSQVKPFGPENHAFGCLDYGRGIWPYNTVWNWAAASGVQGQRTIGITLGGQWTDGTGMTENALCVDGRVHKLSEDLLFSYDRHDWMEPWHIRAPRSRRVDLVLHPFYERCEKVNALLLRSEVHALFGHFSGSIVTDEGERIEIPHLLGWAEEHRARW